MGYKTETDIPNYWAYARDFVLQDHLFEPNRSLEPSRPPIPGLGVVGALQQCPTNPTAAPMRSRAPGTADANPNDPFGTQPDYAWTPVTYLLHNAGVSWGYYIKRGLQPDCADDQERCTNPPRQGPATPGIWNPLPNFTTVRINREESNIKDTSAFLNAAQNGTLPAVSWVVPSQAVSEHPPGVDRGRAGIRHESDQQGDGRPRLAEHRDLLKLG